MLALPASVGLGEAQDVLKGLKRAVVVDSAAPLVVDAAALQRFDSSALAILLDCRRMALAANRPFVLHSPPPRLNQLARLYGVASLLGIEAPVSGTVHTT